MKISSFLIVIFNLLLFTNKSICQEPEFLKHMERAEIASFYSASLLNGYYELELAFDYLDSAENDLNNVKDTLLYNSLFPRFKSLKDELGVSKDIAADNLNYIYLLRHFLVNLFHAPEPLW